MNEKLRTVLAMLKRAGKLTITAKDLTTFLGYKDKGQSMGGVMTQAGLRSSYPLEMTMLFRANERAVGAGSRRPGGAPPRGARTRSPHPSAGEGGARGPLLRSGRARSPPGLSDLPGLVSPALSCSDRGWPRAAYRGRSPAHE